MLSRNKVAVPEGAAEGNNPFEYFVVKIELKSVKQITYKIRRNFFNKFPPYLYLPIIISIIVWGVLPFHSIMQNRELL